MAVHKNYIEWYWRDWDKLCTEELLPYQNDIFKLFSDKFYTDAEKDRERWRKLLTFRWYRCSQLCKEIHENLEWNDIVDEELKDLVNNVVNLDYNSLSEVFQTLEDKYSNQWEEWIASQIKNICDYLEKMWRISKPHTEIKSL